jgi:hypothetical protein
MASPGVAVGVEGAPVGAAPVAGAPVAVALRQALKSRASPLRKMTSLVRMMILLC